MQRTFADGGSSIISGLLIAKSLWDIEISQDPTPATQDPTDPMSWSRIPHDTHTVLKSLLNWCQSKDQYCGCFIMNMGSYLSLLYMENMKCDCEFNTYFLNDTVFSIFTMIVVLFNYMFRQNYSTFSLFVTKSVRNTYFYQSTWDWSAHQSSHHWVERCWTSFPSHSERSQPAWVTFPKWSELSSSISSYFLEDTDIVFRGTKVILSN